MTNIEIIIQLSKQLTYAEIIALRAALWDRKEAIEKLEREKFKQLGAI